MTCRSRVAFLHGALAAAACLSACGSSSNNHQDSGSGGTTSSASGAGGSSAGAELSGNAGRADSNAGAGGSAAANGGSGAGKAGAASTTAGNSSSAGAAGSSAETMTPEGACRAAIEAQCDVKTRCGYYSDAGLCTPFAELCPDYYFAEGSTRTVESVLACLDRLRQQSCDEVRAGVVPDCLTGGTLADRASCTYAAQCASGVCNTNGGQGCATCQSEPGEGESCDQVCRPGFFCHPSTKRCTPSSSASRAAEGAACDLSGTPFVGCEQGLACWASTAGATPTCQPTPGDGEPCPGGTCTAPLICQVPTENNPICSDRAGCSPACPSGSHCVSMGDTIGCAPLADAGEACAVSEDCAGGLICKGGACVAQKKVGEACDDPADCPAPFPCVNGVCRWQAACP